MLTVIDSDTTFIFNYFLSSSDIWWLRTSNLFAEDKLILESVSWLNDNIIQAAQNLLKKETNLSGLQSPLLGINYQFKAIKLTCGFVQILNLCSNHWVTVSNKVGGLVIRDNVYVFDSLMPNKVDMNMIKQVCSLLKSPSRSLFFNIVDVMRQQNSYDCGLHAVAAATDIVFAKDPVKSRWDFPRMRPHLLQCLEEGKISPFPVIAERPIRFGRRIKLGREIDVYCCCRMPYNSKESDGMIQCQMCLVWYHGHCVPINVEEYKHSNWHCTKCNELMT